MDGYKIYHIRGTTISTQENKSPWQIFKNKNYFSKDSTLGAFWHLAFRDHDSDGPGNETEWKHHNINIDNYLGKLL